SPTMPVTTDTNLAISGQATDERSGLARVQEQLDGGTFAVVPFDASGNFSFTTTLALDGTEDGSHTVQVRATDNAGNLSALAVYTFTLNTQPGGTPLVEGIRFLTPLEQTFVVPAQPSRLEFHFDNLHFDTHANFIKDAFEASLTDATGNP